MIFLSGLMIGLIGSIHCIGMCGPLVIALNYQQKNLFKNLLYHGGRLTCYLALGAIIGLMGTGISLAGTQQWLSIITGGMVITLTLLPRVRISFTNNQWQRIVLMPMKRKLLSMVNNSRSGTMFTLGFLNGLLPCGVVYLALAVSLATGGAFEASLLMAGFGIGTWPALLPIAMGSSWMMKNVGLKLSFTIPVMSVLLGMMLILRGMALDIPYLSPVLNALSSESIITTCQTP